MNIKGPLPCLAVIERCVGKYAANNGHIVEVLKQCEVYGAGYWTVTCASPLVVGRNVMRPGEKGTARDFNLRQIDNPGNAADTVTVNEHPAPQPETV